MSGSLEKYLQKQATNISAAIGNPSVLEQLFSQFSPDVISLLDEAGQTVASEARSNYLTGVFQQKSPDRFHRYRAFLRANISKNPDDNLSGTVHFVGSQADHQYIRSLSDVFSDAQLDVISQKLSRHQVKTECEIERALEETEILLAETAPAVDALEIPQLDQLTDISQEEHTDLTPLLSPSI